MLIVQRLLRDGKPLADLQAEFALRVATHPELPLVILNYSQTESKPKGHPVVRECRGLVLERGSWNVVARAFPRFFAWGEAPDCDKAFDWSGAHVQEKHDGSLVLVFWYGGKLFVNTRGSFGTGPIQRGASVAWEDVFYSALRPDSSRDSRSRIEADLPDGFTAVFELCSPLNRVVRKYDAPEAYLLSVFRTETGDELAPDLCDRWAEEFGARRPATVIVASLAQLTRIVAVNADPTFEGYVARDFTGRRKKVKSGRYEALHRVKCGVEPALSPKTFAPFLAVEGDRAPLIDCLGEHAHHLLAAQVAVDRLVDGMEAAWDAHRDQPDQKAFALAVAGTDARPFLFEARKRKCHPRDVWAERGEAFLEGWLCGRVPREEPPVGAGTPPAGAGADG